jgi:hypothetical protein
MSLSKLFRSERQAPADEEIQDEEGSLGDSLDQPEDGDTADIDAEELAEGEEASSEEEGEDVASDANLELQAKLSQQGREMAILKQQIAAMQSNQETDHSRNQLESVFEGLDPEDLMTGAQVKDVILKVVDAAQPQAAQAPVNNAQWVDSQENLAEIEEFLQSGKVDQSRVGQTNDVGAYHAVTAQILQKKLAIAEKEVQRKEAIIQKQKKSGGVPPTGSKGAGRPNAARGNIQAGMSPTAKLLGRLTERQGL